MKNLKIALIVVMGLLTISCNKDDDDQQKPVDSDLALANSVADITTEGDFNYSIELADTYSSYYSLKNSDAQSPFVGCPTISVNNTTPGVFPKIFNVDFGSGCTINGITRRGTITITLSNYVNANGSTLTIERGTNYYINNRKIEGTVVYTNQTTNVNIPTWQRTVTNGKITFLTGAYFTHNGTRNVRQTAGVGTLIMSDNVYEVFSGTHTVTRSNGTSLTSTVLQPLIKKFNCDYISQGQLDLNGTVLDGVLDFGDNTCDNLATYTHSNGQVYNITLN